MSIIFRNIEFHNVEEIEQQGSAYKLSRIPLDIAQRVNRGIRSVTSWCTTGVELRFRLISKEAKIILRADDAAEAQVAYLYYGSIQGGWDFSSKVISNHETYITVKYPDKQLSFSNCTEI